MHASTKKNLYQLLCEQEDPRRQQGTRHKLPFTMTIVIMAIMSDCLSISAMSDFATRHQKALFKLFKLKKKKRRIPSRVTISRMLAVLDFEQLSSMFQLWASQYVEFEKGDWLAIDGKAIGGTVKNANSHWQTFTSLVSVFAHKRGQVLAVRKLENSKESEIPAVKYLVRILDLEGAVFTLDALHCQKDTTKEIIESKNDYVIGVKGNQKKLLQQVKKTPKQARLLVNIV